MGNSDNEQPKIKNLNSFSRKYIGKIDTFFLKYQNIKEIIKDLKSS